jgi:hypothetical protein
MRTILALLLVLAGCADDPTGPAKLLYGDVQGDGEVTQVDGDLIYALTTGSAVEPMALILACGDVDGDRTISVLDAYMVYAHVQGVTRGRVGKPCMR